MSLSSQGLLLSLANGSVASSLRQGDPMKPFSFCFLAGFLLTICGGCSPAARTNIGAALGGAANGVAQPLKLMLFGGEGHSTYLGCLSCSEYATDSVFNEYGGHGSRYSNVSIWNQYGDFGSRYSDYGACNAYANDPPVIVDSAGKFYGRLTLNMYHPQFGARERYHDWLLNSVCEH
jgi:hypothetical protein